jgi:ceramide glucosyltransferase
MQIEFLTIFNIAVALICLSSFGYLVFALFAVERFHHKRKKSSTATDFQPAVTILKPIYGLDPELADNLRSFCQQDYPKYQIIFALHNSNDPALPIIKKVIKEFKKVDVSYVVDSHIYGTNRKVSNLINAHKTAKHEYILIADSDMRVPTNYLSEVMSPFADAEVGAVTCLYSGSARGKLASTLNAMFINEWFLPSVLISRILQPVKFCLGATMIVRRDLLNKIGGFKALSNYLADDYMLGKLVSDLGYKIHLSDFIVENIVEEASLKDLLLHELRWARTLRRVEPLGYFFTFLTDTFVMSCLASITVYMATQNISWSLIPVLLVFMARIFLHSRTKQITGSSSAGSIWLIPLRDLLSFSIRVISFTGTSIHWRNNAFNVDTSGLMHTEEELLLDRDAVEKVPGLATSQDY